MSTFKQVFHNNQLPCNDIFEIFEGIGMDEFNLSIRFFGKIASRYMIKESNPISKKSKEELQFLNSHSKRDLFRILFHLFDQNDGGYFTTIEFQHLEPTLH